MGRVLPEAAECDIRWKRPTGCAYAELLPANLCCPQHHHAAGRRGSIAGAQGERLHTGGLGGRNLRRTAVRDPLGRVALRAVLQQNGYGERWLGSRQTAAEWG